MWNLVSVHLEVVLFSAQDRGTVCVECTTAMEIIFGTPDGTPTLQGVVTHVEARFGLYGGSVSLSAR